MSAETTVVCDGCGKEIETTTVFEYESYLELRAVWKGHQGGAVLSTGIPASIERTQHFHGYHCIRAKVDADRAEVKRREELQAADPSYVLDFSTDPPKRVGRRLSSRASHIWGPQGDPDGEAAP